MSPSLMPCFAAAPLFHAMCFNKVVSEVMGFLEIHYDCTAVLVRALVNGSMAAGCTTL